MKFSFATALVVALAADTAVASTWFSKAAYNKWNENELESWLSDHDVPYPTPADRKDLENLVKDNWNSAVESPYVNWDTNQLNKYLSEQGQEVKKGTEKNKDELVKQVKSSWKDTSDSANSAYGSVRDWVFDSWTESSLKSFCDKHGIPVPQPRTRDQALKAVRENYQSAADKVGQAASYPGDWLYETWSDSDLKAWLDERGIAVPQGGNRNKLIASVRRNAYISRNTISEYAAAGTDSAKSVATSASSYAKGAAGSVTDAAKGAASSASDLLFDTWSDSQIKEWADKNGVKVPQGSNRNELLAVVRKYAAKLTGDNVSNSAYSAYGAATSSAGNYAAQVTDDVSSKANGLGGQAYSMFNSYFYEAQVLLGLKTNYASSASASASSVYAKASSAVRGEL